MNELESLKNPQDVDRQRDRLRQIAAFVIPNEDQRAALEERLGELRHIADEWGRSGSMPQEARALSSGEFSAVCMATGNSAELSDAICAFFLLDGWLQRWVLLRRGLAPFIGTRVGTDVP